MMIFHSYVSLPEGMAFQVVQCDFFKTKSQQTAKLSNSITMFVDHVTRCITI